MPSTCASFRALLSVALLLGCSVAGLSAADEKKEDKKAEGKSGSVTGVVAAKDKDGKWIEVKADGEEKARRYVPTWVGGTPKDGGGPDKEMVREIGKVPVGARIKLDWKFEERPRVIKIEVLKLPAREKEKDGR